MKRGIVAQLGRPGGTQAWKSGCSAVSAAVSSGERGSVASTARTRSGWRGVEQSASPYIGASATVIRSAASAGRGSGAPPTAGVRAAAGGGELGLVERFGEGAPRVRSPRSRSAREAAGSAARRAARRRPGCAPRSSGAPSPAAPSTGFASRPTAQAAARSTSPIGVGWSRRGRSRGGRGWRRLRRRRLRGAAILRRRRRGRQRGGQPREASTFFVASISGHRLLRFISDLPAPTGPPT